VIGPCVSAVAGLPRLHDWVPGVLNDLTARTILSWGLPLALLSDVPALDPFRRKLSKQIRENDCPNDSDLAEISGAALLRVLGGQSTRPASSKLKTPDFVTKWPSGEIDCEVTCPQNKPDYLRRVAAAEQLTHRIHGEGRPNDLILHLADLPSDAHTVDILKAANNLGVGEEKEEVGEWHLRAKVPDRHPHTLYTAGENHRPPSWWPETKVSHVSFSQTLAGPTETVCPPRTLVVMSIPFDAYLNPVQNKADRPQGAGKALLVAVDVHHLPGAYSAFTKGLPSYFSIWPHVSGVLAYESLSQRDRLGWHWQLFTNLLAVSPLPPELIAAQGAKSQMLETAYRLVSNDVPTPPP
jgi:hypothetical protein